MGELPKLAASLALVLTLHLACTASAEACGRRHRCACQPVCQPAYQSGVYTQYMYMCCDPVNHVWREPQSGDTMCQSRPVGDLGHMCGYGGTPAPVPAPPPR